MLIIYDRIYFTILIKLQDKIEPLQYIQKQI